MPASTTGREKPCEARNLATGAVAFARLPAPNERKNPHPLLRSLDRAPCPADGYCGGHAAARPSPPIQVFLRLHRYPGPDLQPYLSCLSPAELLGFFLSLLVQQRGQRGAGLSG